MIKIRDNIDLNVLEKFGFELINNHWMNIRKIGDKIVYVVIITNTHRYLQIRCNDRCVIAGRLQTLIYDLTVAGIIEKEED